MARHFFLAGIIHLWLPLNSITQISRACARRFGVTNARAAATIQRLVLSKPANYDYRLAFLVARVLSSPLLKQRAKWCRFAQRLVSVYPGIENRLIDQSMRLIALQKRGGLRPACYRPKRKARKLSQISGVETLESLKQLRDITCDDESIRGLCRGGSPFA